jgi:O-antigen ligase
VDRARGFLFLAFNNAHNATGSVYAGVSLTALVFFLKEKGVKKILYALMTLILLAALILTNSRGSIVGFIAGLVIVFWFNFKPIKFIKVFGALILLSIPIIYFSKIYRSILAVFSLEGTTLTRISLWTKALNLFNQSPLFGVGFGRFNDINDQNFSLSGIRGFIAFYIRPVFNFNTAHAHNSYLQFLSETGIIGLSLILFFWILCFLKLARAYRDTKNDFSARIFLSGIGIIICLLVMSLTENYLSATTVMMYVSMLLSLSIGLHWQEKVCMSGERDKNFIPGLLSGPSTLAKENIKD